MQIMIVNLQIFFRDHVHIYLTSLQINYANLTSEMNFEYCGNALDLCFWFVQLFGTDTVFFFKDAWHEFLEKLISLKLADKVSFHLNIPQWKKCTVASCSEVIGENCAYVMHCFIFLSFGSPGVTANILFPNIISEYIHVK